MEQPKLSGWEAEFVIYFGYWDVLASTLE